MRFVTLPALALAFTFSLAAAAQTYTPKHIRVQGPDGLDKADILRTAGLTEGIPLTKEQIEAALGKLSDSGAFSDLSYTVNSEALVIQLTASPSTRVLPVTYSNFVWWNPDELTPLIQARVPLYQGKLPLTGNLTDQVEAALVAMLNQKGVDASVTTIEAMSGDSIALSISRPQILVGEVKVQGSLPAVSAKLKQMQAGFVGQDFDRGTITAIPRNVTDIYNDAGYLDASVDAPMIAPPRKDLDRYIMDATTAVHPGEIYRIVELNLDAPPPLARGDMEKAVGLKAGDPAGAFPLQHAADAVAFAYKRRGFLDAVAHVDFRKDAAAHSVQVKFDVTPGEIYHVASLDTRALPPALQAAFASNFQVKPGTTAGDEIDAQIQRALSAIRAADSVRLKPMPDRATHTEVIALVPAPARH